MPKDMREPQSYGSEKDWTTGKTGEQVNSQKSEPTPEHRDFYDDRRESGTSSPYQGGKTSPVQLAENIQPQGEGTGASNPVQKVTTQDGGVRSDSFFKRRDYDS